MAGPTATGKSGLAIELALAARELGRPAEIISADSRQVYRGMDIGTAKTPSVEREGVPHHGLDLVDPDEAFSVADFARHASQVLGDLAARDPEAIAILVGGTGLYLRAVARDLDTGALPVDPGVRARVEAGLERAGLRRAVERLTSIAPRLAVKTDLKNPRRVARALEIALLAGDVDRPTPGAYGGRLCWLGLTLDPPTNREWIAKRARNQFEAGLLEEARDLRDRYGAESRSFSAFGYREAFAVLDGRLELQAAIDEDVRRTVAFAKRQRTWFRSERSIDWIDAAADPLNAALPRLRAFLDA